MNNPHLTVHQKKIFMRRLNVQRYLCDKRKLCLSFVGQQTLEHMDLFPVQILPLGEKKSVEGGVGKSILHSSPRNSHSSPVEI